MLRPDPTIHHAVAAARARFVAAGIDPDEAALDAELLARHVRSWDRATYISRGPEAPDADFLARFELLTRRRERREPVAQIVGRREFWGLDFLVTRDVLIPRPETELIVEASLEMFGASPPRLVVDAAAGSGCLAVALARQWPDTRFVATDISADALRVARTNVDRYALADRVRLVQMRYIAGVRPPVPLIVSNPPYIPATDAAALPPEVRDYEPHVALFGGLDGLDAYRELLAGAKDLLAAGGYLIVEFGCGQAPAISDLVGRHTQLQLVATRPDLQGIPRVAIVRRLEGTS